jgi:uncharacterized protein YdaU (DUF1376 family)
MVHTPVVSDIGAALLRYSAVELAKQGYRVFPLHISSNGKCSCGNPACPSPGKHPRINGWREKASSDPIIVDTFWARFPDSNIGIATGQGSDVVVLDVDGEIGEATLKSLAEAHGGLPDTLTVLTGRGKHLYFKAPGTRLGNRVGTLGPGVDIRGDGGYVVAPPSKHHNGSTYEWVDPKSNIAEMPDWITQLSNDTTQDKQEGNLTGKIDEGNRNDSLFKLGASMRGRGHTQAEIGDALLVVNEDQCDPPLSQEEVRQIAESAAAYPAGPVRPAKDGKNSFWWFPIDVNEWCKDRRILFLKDYQVGWFIWLKIEAWNTKGFLPNDPEVLAVLARAANKKKFIKEKAAVMVFFEQSADGTHIFDPELLEYCQQKSATVERNRRAGKESGKRRREPQDQPLAS